MGQIIRKGVEYCNGSGGGGASDWNELENKPFDTLSEDDFNVDENNVLSIKDKGSADWIGTKEEYDALPDSKLSDDKDYYIVDYVEDDGNRDKTSSAGVIGEIIAYMGNSAPDNFLVCDGSIYAISSYPTLAAHIKAEFGSYNFFGGDGSSTFAVPDLRGEFLRGSGENSHENSGNGADVGIHQKPTQIANMWTYDNLLLGSYIPNTGISPKDKDSEISEISSSSNSISVQGGPAPGGPTYSKYTVRPTNTSVLYCIRYAKDNSTEISYSTEEQFTGRYWLDGKKIYQKTMILTSISTESSSSGVVIGNLNINSINEIIDTKFILNPGRDDGYACFIDSTLCTANPSNNIYNFCGFWIRANGEIVMAASAVDKINRKIYFTINYTKTEE